MHLVGTRYLIFLQHKPLSSKSGQVLAPRGFSISLSSNVDADTASILGITAMRVDPNA